MIELDYRSLERAAVETDPFPHVLVEKFVPPKELQAVVDALPRLTHRGSFPITSLRLGEKAADLMGELAGRRFQDLVGAKFGLTLAGSPTMITLRGQSTDRDGHIHCDSGTKRVTVLLYLNPDNAAWSRREGCLRLLRGPGDIEDYAVEVAPVQGNLLIFPNGPQAWHGHKIFVGQRYVVQLNYMTKDRAARAELRRHRISAFLKRLSA